MSKVVVVGLGYVGLVVATRAAEVGHDVVGLEVDPNKVTALNACSSYIEDVSDEQLAELASAGNFHAVLADDALSAIAGFDVGIIAVPTPLRGKVPDLSYVESAGRMLAKHLQPGATIVLESSTYPGTTEGILMDAVFDVADMLPPEYRLGFSPERIDPGNTHHTFKNTPKLVSGVDAASLIRVQAFYDTLVDVTVAVSSPKVAEITKLFENIFAHVNIGLVNEMASLCHELEIDVWEMISAAQTKGHSVMPWYPGPGVGGHCFGHSTLVMTEHGPRMISSIEPGTRVLSSDGRLHEVTRVFRHDYSGDLVSIKVRGMPATLMTPDHEVYTVEDLRPSKMQRRHFPVAGRSASEYLGDIRCVQASDVVPKHHYMMWPHIQAADVVTPDHATPEYVELAGWYLSEGNLVVSRNSDESWRSARVQISLGAERNTTVQSRIDGSLASNVALVTDLLKTVGKQFGPVNYRSNRADARLQDRGTCKVIRYGSLSMAHAILNDFNQHAVSKRIPAWILWGDISFAPLLLRGMFRGDAHASLEGTYAYSTISPDLAYGAVVLLDRLGIATTVTTQMHKNRRHLAYKVSISTTKDRVRLAEMFEVTLPKVFASSNTQYPDRGDGNIYRSVEEVNLVNYSGQVYDLEVEGTHKYVVPAGVVSNCLPVDPVYLSWLSKARLNKTFRFAELADDINSHMPDYVVSRVTTILNERRISLNGSSVLVVGVAYKPGTGDMREAPSLEIVRLLEDRGARVTVSDPHVNGSWKLTPSIGLEEMNSAGDYTVAIVVTNHPEFDYAKLAKNANLVFDTRNCMEPAANVVVL